VAGGEDKFRKAPFVVHYSEPISPLRHTTMGMDKLLFCAEKGMPIVYAPCTTAGGTTPASMASTLVVSNAEVLSGLVVHQLKVPGAPFIYGGLNTVLDMSATVFSYGAPEMPLMSAAMAEMARFYKLPTWSTACCTDSKVVDQQTAAEYMDSALLAGLSGASLIHDCGYLESGLLASYESIVLADEVVGSVRRILQGIEVNDDTLALDVIDRVGPGGFFLDTDYTLEHFRKEFWFPRRFNRQRNANWEHEGSHPLFFKLNQEAKYILAQYTPQPLEDDKQKSIKQVIKRLERNLVLA